MLEVRFFTNYTFLTLVLMGCCSPSFLIGGEVHGEYDIRISIGQRILVKRAWQKK